MPFIHFYVFAVARTSSTALNNSAESRLSCFVPDLKGNTSSFCPLSMMLAMVYSYMVFITLRYVPSIPTFLRDFNHKWVLDLVKCFLKFIDIIMWFLSLILFMLCITFIDFQILY